jgi:hypothetical protein
MLVTQRWREHRSSYRPAGEPIATRRYGVELVDEGDARAFVVRHHYASSFPAARRSVGLWRTRGAVWAPELVGVAVFSVGVQPASIPRWTGQDAKHGIELGRFVLLDEVEANGETWFLRRAFDVLRAELPEVRAVLAYSDPMPRTDADGLVTMPGHVGTIYQAHNGRYVGRASRRLIHLRPDGRAVSGRAETKIRKGETGAGPEIDRLIADGARRPQRGEDLRAWLDDVLASPPFRSVRHPGNHAYAWPIDGRRDTARAMPATAGPYPKLVEQLAST